jgi:hypothetical protein
MVVQPVMSEETSRVEVPPPAEIHMDVTPDPQKTDAVLHASDAAHSSSEAQEIGAVTAAQVPGDDMRQAVVVPLARSPIARAGASDPAEDAAVIHTLQIAARGASTVYVVAQSKPLLRVDGESACSRASR